MRLLLVLLILLPACSKTVESPGDDYVLIEFASKLEEDYQKLAPPAPPVEEKKSK